MAMQAGQRKGVMGDMNVVPLIDILLVLLIIFMVIAPTASHGLQAVIPQPQPRGISTPPPADTVIVQVLSGGGIKINQEDATWDTLGPRLQAIFKLRAEKVAFVRGDADVPFAQIARAIAIMRNSDLEKVGLITASMVSSQ